ncbi:MAG: tryptophan synthase subunit alpha [Deltaproteobacteria bacterium]|nr:tryptophan synthase subunit alpha [Deltaproteobacteria bacterium]
MGRIEDKLQYLKAKNEKALIFYLTAGDPGLDVMEALIYGLERAGADILEVGVPFSDPTADGPVIQAASQRALKNKTTLSGILHLIEKVRRKSDIPIVLFGYYNPVFIYGCRKFAKRAEEAGVDGLLIVDLPFEESPELRRYTDACGIDFISLIAPTTNNDRIKAIAAQSGGFLYYISITGVTGTAKPKPADVKKEVHRIKRITSLPVVVGFGITTPKEASAIAPLADGIVVGSALVKLIEENSRRADLIKKAEKFAADFKKAIKQN